MKIMGMKCDEIATTLMPKLPPEKAREILTNAQKNEMSVLLKQKGELFDGIEKMLQEVSGKYFTAIVSNCNEGYIETFLEMYGFDKYINDFQFCDSEEVTKADNILRVIKRNDINSAVYVGDIQKDCDSSRQACVPFIWASYGFGNVKNYDKKISAPKDIFKAVQEILESEYIYTEKTIIRPVQPKDKKDMVKILCDKDLYEFDISSPCNLQQAEEEFENMLRDKNSYSVICKADKKIMGKLYLQDESDEKHKIAIFELGYVFSKKYQKKGYAKESINAFCCHMSRQHRKATLIAFTSQRNEPSKSILKSCGFNMIRTIPNKFNRLAGMLEIYIKKCE